ncbi:hypothetical protein DPMN_008536 [Dreissena polymorpha]|uniref:Uncharacterized protein n=1 Tax=Dreissena polymorpha TaxID=45954 RepID=A0A9D4MVG7_DREPO|nr:hypothetical protein DPMN_008536 [Dreissena polymorpha]
MQHAKSGSPSTVGESRATRMTQCNSPHAIGVTDNSQCSKVETQHVSCINTDSYAI